MHDGVAEWDEHFESVKLSVTCDWRTLEQKISKNCNFQIASALDIV